MDPDTPATPHLTTEEASAYVDRTLSPADQARIDAHLSHCDACREEVVAVRRLLDDALAMPRTSRWRRPASIAAVAALAAAAVFLMVPRETSGPRESMPEPVRGATSAVGAPMPVSDRTALTTVSPGPGDAVDAAGLRLVWRRSLGDATYHVYVMEPDGTERWSGMTSDTSIAVPASAALVHGRSYRWYVEALHADGSSTRSASEPFAVTR